MKVSKIEFKKYKHLLSLSYYLVILMFYFYVNTKILPENIEVLVYVPIVDDIIPFVKYMIIPYVLWYPFIIVPLIYFAIKDKQAFSKLCFFLFVGMTICYMTFILIPNGIGTEFRPTIIDNDIFSRIIRYIYSIDNPTNSCPSLHVLNAVAMYSAIINSQTLKNNKFITYSSLVLTVLICMSTVMLKQHSIIDVVISLLICTVLYRVLYRVSDSQVTETI